MEKILTRQEIKQLAEEEDVKELIIKPLISALEEEIEEFIELIKRKFQMIDKVSFGDEFSLWFCEEIITTFDVKDLVKKQRKVRYLKYLISEPKNKKDQDLIDENDILQADEVPLADLIGTELRRTGGGRYTCLCPFHTETYPSFTIYPNNSYYCFGCMEHGTAITYLMKANSLTFLEAVKTLTNKI